MNRPFQKELIDCHKKQVSIILRNIIARGNKIKKRFLKFTRRKLRNFNKSHSGETKLRGEYR